MNQGHSERAPARGVPDKGEAMRIDHPKTEEGLRMKRTFAALIDEMDIAMWELDLDYRVLAFNRKAREIYGEKAQGNFCYNAAAGRDTICPDCPALMVYEGAESGRSEHRRRKADGTHIYIDHLATPVRDDAGRVVGALVLIIDITRYKCMEEEVKRHRDELEKIVDRRTRDLRESQNRYRNLYRESKRAEEIYRSLLNSSADAIVVYDLNGNAEFISPSFTRIFGWTFEEVRGRRIPFMPECERERTMAVIVDLLANGTPCQGFETRRNTRDGRTLDVSISASRYFDDHGRPAGLLVILRDISEKKRMEAQLKHAERMEAIGTLAGGIAHDFNNLMMGIIGNVSLMAHEVGPDSPHRDRLAKIEKLIQSGSRLTTQLLGYARKGRYEVRPLPLNHVVRDTAEAFGRTRRQIAIDLCLSEIPLTVEADETQIEQVLFNLYINAADAMPEGGRLVIQTDPAPGVRPPLGVAGPPGRPYIRLRIADTGPGIDEGIIDRIFDPFFTTKPAGKGTGLGLASVYGIVRGHGGFIEVSSAPGEGATFDIYLPASESRRASAAGADAPPPLESGRGRVLLVDDEELVLEVATQMLEKLGYEVRSADSGAAAIAMFNNDPSAFDLVILDMILPGMGGAEIFNRLREIRPSVRVLLSSGYSIDGQAREIMDKGCNGFIQKPFRLEDLANKVRKVLRA